MIRSRHRSSFFSALFALMMGLFVLAPVGDALACGPEQAGDTVAADLLIETGDAHDDGEPCTPAHCAHGHCHVAASLPPRSPDARPAWSARMAAALPSETTHDSAIADGLIRPPRA